MKNTKVLILIDGDNIDESYVPVIYSEASSFMKEGDFFEVHCFGDFVKRKQGWKDAYFKNGVQLHYIPGMEKQKGKPDPNTSDIALTAFAVKQLYEICELETIIIVANDKDYAPLAKVIMEEHKKNAVMFYTQSNDTAVDCYSKAVLLKGIEKVKESPKVEKSEVAEVISDGLEIQSIRILLDCIEDLFVKNPKRVLLAELSPILTHDKGIDYGEFGSIGKYLSDKFDKYSIFKDNYVLTLSDKKDRIERIAK